MKKRMIWAVAVILVLASVLTAACMGCGKKDNQKESKNASEKTTENAEATEATGGSEVQRINWENLTWYDATVNTLGSGKAHASFMFPEDFGGYQEDDVDGTYISYGSSASYGGPEGLYSITARYFRNDEGPSEEDIRALPGTTYDYELNGQAVVVNKIQNEAKDRYYYTYFASFNDDVNSRIVFIVTDAEEYGGFRVMIERKIWWA